MTFKSPEVFTGDISEEFYRIAIASGGVSMDTETTGLDWQIESLQTVQIFVPHQAPVILRPRKRKNPDRLISLLGDPHVRKLFHYAMFDLSFMVRAWEFQCANIVCTKVMSKVLHSGESGAHSLQSLLRRYMSINIDKGQRLSDWSAVELSDEQIIYACNDVRYLHELFALMWLEANKRGVAERIRMIWSRIPHLTESRAVSEDDFYGY